MFHPTGGCGAVMVALARIARSLGVDIRLGEPAKAIEFEGRRAIGVHTESDYYPTDALVVNADFAQAMQQLVPDRLRRRWNDSQLERKKYSCSTFMIYAGIEGRYDHVPHHTVFLADDYVKNLRDIETDH